MGTWVKVRCCVTGETGWRGENARSSPRRLAQDLPPSSVGHKSFCLSKFNSFPLVAVLYSNTKETWETWMSGWGDGLVGKMNTLVQIPAATSMQGTGARIYHAAFETSRCRELGVSEPGQMVEFRFQ